MKDISEYIAAATRPIAKPKPKPSAVARVAIVKHLLLRDYAICSASRSVPAAEELAVIVDTIARECRCCNRGLRFLFDNAREWKTRDRKDSRPLTAADLIYSDSYHTNWETIGIDPKSVVAILPSPNDSELLQIPAVTNLLNVIKNHKAIGHEK